MPEKIAKSSVPDYSDLILWKAEGINSIVNLLEDGYHEIVQDEKEVGFNVLHSPISDFDAPTLDQLPVMFPNCIAPAPGIECVV